MSMNDIVIIGIDHHNGLNLGRCFYNKGMNVYCLVHTSKRHAYLKLSKYFKEVLLFRNPSDACEYAVNRWKNSISKPVLFPVSDEAAAYVDDNLDLLGKIFITPAIKGIQGSINRLMNKANQKEFIHSSAFPSAKYTVLQLGMNIIQPFNKCIIKAITSAEGKKSDIRITKNQIEFDEAVKYLIHEGYNRVLVEEYLDIDYEIQLIGCICKNNRKNYFSIHRIIRTYPIGKGTGCFEKTIVEESIIKQCELFLQKINELGFYGLIDVEFFSVDGKIYVNEVNWRNSGCLYNIWSNNYNFPYAWYLDATGISDTDFTINDNMRFDSDYSMTEYSDIRYPLYYKEIIEFKEWKQQFKYTKNFAYLHKEDMMPALAIYFRLFIRFLSGSLKEK